MDAWMESDIGLNVNAKVFLLTAGEIIAVTAQQWRPPARLLTVATAAPAQKWLPAQTTISLLYFQIITIKAFKCNLHYAKRNFYRVRMVFLAELVEYRSISSEEVIVD